MITTPPVRQKFFRHSVASIDDVIPEILKGLQSGLKKPRAVFNEVSVKVAGLRLETFATKGLKCAKCQLQATFFAIERDSGKEATNGVYHLNLYGVQDGVEVLFTHDHIIARANGGADKLHNTQTMCYWCNQEKADT